MTNTKVPALEKRYKKPLKEILLENLNKHGKSGTGRKLGVTRMTLDLWCKDLKIVRRLSYVIDERTK